MLCSLASLVQCFIETFLQTSVAVTFVAKYNVLVIIECTVLLEILKCLKGSVFSLIDTLQKTEQLMPFYVTLFLIIIKFLCLFVPPYVCGNVFVEYCGKHDNTVDNFRLNWSLINRQFTV